MSFRRELSIEERCSFANLLTDNRLTDIPARYTPVSIRSIDVFVVGGMTIEEMHARLDQQDVPRYTDNPYPLFEVEDFIQSSNAKLYALQLRDDGRIKCTDRGYFETMLAKSLNGYLKRSGDDLLYIRDEDGAMVDVLIRPGDFLIRRTKDMRAYGYWLAAKDTDEVTPDE